MRTFYCDHCEQPIFFENVQCLNCNHTLGYLQDRQIMSALQADGDQWRALVSTDTASEHYRMCANYAQENVCNWMIPADDPEIFCESCRLNQTIPDLGSEENRQCWARLEAAKRRLVYSLKKLELPLQNKSDNAETGLAFAFLADPNSDFSEREHVVTGHADGLITINIAEADDAVRERLRLDLNERYRTLLGHFRHEVGHYYWDQLIRDGDRLTEYRQCFGDERADYATALNEYYANGPIPNWQQHFISTYASAHPWEDWAETWAHYLHMIDTLETAQDFGLRLRALGAADQPKKHVRPAPQVGAERKRPFERMLEQWRALTFAINSINRSMGLNDLYPFALSSSVLDKLRFIDRLIGQVRNTSGKL